MMPFPRSVWTRTNQAGRQHINETAEVKLLSSHACPVGARSHEVTDRSIGRQSHIGASVYDRVTSPRGPYPSSMCTSRIRTSPACRSRKVGGHRVILRESYQLDSTKEHTMTTAHDIDLHQFLTDRVTDASPDLLRSLLSTFIDALMGAEADTLCGAGFGERSDDRINSRNGYRHRDFDTRAGTLDIAIPKLRSGSYFPDWLLQRRKRAERALTSVVATCYLLGVSTRRMEKLVDSLGITGLGVPPCTKCLGEPSRRSASWPRTSTPRSKHSAADPWTPARTPLSPPTPSSSRSARTVGWSTCTPWSRSE